MVRRPRRSLKRTTALRPELRTFLVFCEGEASEPDYINGLKKILRTSDRNSADIRIYHEFGNAPLTMVKIAVTFSDDPEIDECWCLFDVEWPQNHPNLSRAVALAQSTGVKLAISNPCFELWLVLHRTDYTRFVDTKPIESHSKKLDGRAGKRIDANFYLPHRKDAIRRAESLEKRHQGDGTVFPQDNPSSGMHHFLKAVEPGK